MCLYPIYHPDVSNSRKGRGRVGDPPFDPLVLSVGSRRRRRGTKKGKEVPLPPMSVMGADPGLVWDW